MRGPVYVRLQSHSRFPEAIKEMKQQVTLTIVIVVLDDYLEGRIVSLCGDRIHKCFDVLQTFMAGIWKAIFRFRIISNADDPAERSAGLRRIVDGDSA